nr:MAG TPA: hypothetical protein [Caudoviricetes sp.]
MICVALLPHTKRLNLKQRLNGSMREYKWINVQFVTIRLICVNAGIVVVVIQTEASVEK